jgi:TM2 domain-containing membrane protein YozV
MMTTTIIRRETRKRGFFGIIFRILFYAFNIFMLLWVSVLWYGLANLTGQHDIRNPATGAAGLAGTGMIAIMWLLGDAILGALVLMTRGSKIVVEEQIDAKRRQITAPGRSKTTAALFAIFLGGVGIHRFYLGRPVSGMLYLVFCWTLIPAFIGFLEGLILLSISEDDFAQRYA